MTHYMFPYDIILAKYMLYSVSLLTYRNVCMDTHRTKYEIILPRHIKRVTCFLSNIGDDIENDVFE